MDTLTKIEYMLKERRCTKKQLCDRIGISGNNFTAWKSGQSESYMKYLPQIAEFLDVSVDYLLGKEEDEELARYLEHLRTRPEMRMMFQLAEGATKEDVEKAVKILEALLKK